MMPLSGHLANGTRRWHASELLLLDEPLFLPTLFTFPNQQPLQRTDDFARSGLPTTIANVPRGGLDGYAARLVDELLAARRSEPAYVFLIKGEATVENSERLDLILNRARYAIYHLAALIADVTKNRHPPAADAGPHVRSHLGSAAVRVFRYHRESGG